VLSVAQSVETPGLRVTRKTYLPATVKIRQGRRSSDFSIEDDWRRCSSLSIEAPESIFVLKPSSLGDIVHTLPAVSRLKATWPDAKISWLVNPEWAPLLDGNPDVAETVLFPRRDFRGIAGLRKLHSWAHLHVLGRRPDLALDFQGLLRTALIGRLSRPRRFLGLADAREGATLFYGRSVPPPALRLHAVDRYLALTDAAIGTPFDALNEPLRFPLPAGEPVAAGGADLEPDFVLLHPFARGTAKSLTLEQVRAFCAGLGPRQIVLAGRHDDPAFRAPAGTVDLLNRTTLPQLIWLLRRAAFVISVDSGPMHLAAALGRPLVAIHTWSDPRRVGPYRPDAWVWKSGRLALAGDIAAGRFDEVEAAAAPLTGPQIDAICALV
jgi:heptosyltransferase-1